MIPAGILASSRRPYNYNVEVMADSPGLYWRLGETSGTVVVDSSGNGRNGLYGTYGGSTAPATSLLPGDANLAREFSGGDAEIEWASWQDATVFTAEAIFTYVGGGLMMIFSNDGGSSPSARWWNLAVNNSGPGQRVWFHNPSDSHDFYGSTILSASTRYHVALVADSGSTKIYLNGVLDASSAYPIPSPPGSNRAMIVGASEMGTGGGSARFYQWDDIIDEFAWYPAALSAGRILTHAQAAGLA